jgi:hypothetical protein
MNKGAVEGCVRMAGNLGNSVQVRECPSEAHHKIVISIVFQGARTGI